MTPEQQRIAIAEACGWERVSVIGYPAHPKEWDDIAQLPNYLNDLNAMHEAVSSLNPGLRDTYLDILTEQVVHKNAIDLDGSIHDRNMPVVHATAAQRAEAFLRTLNLWQS